MRGMTILGFAAAMIAGSAAAQGTFNSGGLQTGPLAPPGYRPAVPPTYGARRDYGVPVAPAYRPAPHRAASPSITDGGAGFKPYEPPKPFTGASTYDLPKRTKPRF